MSDTLFSSTGDSLIAPARIAFAIIPDDESNLPRPAKALYVGIGGDITLQAISGEADVTLRNVASGSVLAIRLKAVRATGTSADNLIGLA
jgi:hypothetical protein